jgi:hypothetical protein
LARADGGMSLSLRQTFSYPLCVSQAIPRFPSHSVRAPDTTASGESFSGETRALRMLLEESLMRTIEARRSCGFLATARLHGRHRATVIAIALFVFSGMLQASGQGITATPAQVSGSITSRQESCSAYQSLATIPGGCVSSDLFPLFNSQSLGNDWRQFLLGPHAPKFHETVHDNGNQTCITVSNFTVDLSAFVPYGQIGWIPTPPVGPVCTNESIRVNTAVSAVSVQTFQADADEIVRRMSLALRRSQRLMAPACGRNRFKAQTALYAEIWALLNKAAQEEKNAWRAHDPEAKYASQCQPQCALCTPGWTGLGGTITCTRTVRDTDPSLNYTWDETQTWIVGGTPQSGMGGTIYPATLTAKGGGHKIDSGSPTGFDNWTVDDTPTQGTVKVIGTQQMPTFQNSQTTIHITSIPTGHDTD